MYEDKLNQTASTIQSLLFNAIRKPDTFTDRQGRPYSDGLKAKEGEGWKYLLCESSS